MPCEWVRFWIRIRARIRGIALRASDRPPFGSRQALVEVLDGGAAPANNSNEETELSMRLQGEPDVHG